MNTNRIIGTTIVATSAMTLFSYWVTKSKNRNFVEPDNLKQLIQKAPIESSKTSSKLAGWLGHYAVGLLFVGIYDQFWKNKKISPSISSGAILGAASGAVGIGGWKAMFEMHPNPPSKNLKRYFGHLMLAHVVFGIAGALTYKSYPETND